MSEEVLSCKDLGDRLKNRADFIQRVEGRAQGKDDSAHWTMLLSMRADRQFWIEIRSPLGGPFAILRADDKWVEFFIPRRKELYTIPAVEFWKASPRQKKFLQILPVRIHPESLYEILMGRLAFDKLEKCKFVVAEQAYNVEVTAAGQQKLAKIDPISFFPIQYGSHNDEFYAKFVGSDVVDAGKVEFGAAFEAYRRGKKEFAFEWTEVRWMQELGDPPPAFHRTDDYKIVNY